VAFDAAGAVTRIDESAALAALDAGVDLELGARASHAAVASIVERLADAAIAFIRGDAPTALGAKLLLTERLGESPAPQAIAFSGGVSEYIYGREARDFGDVARALADRIAAACRSGRIPIPMVAPREGIRATVIGASQFTVQVSGKTIHIGAGVDLPLRNVPVVAPVLELGDDIDTHAVALAISRAVERSPGDDAHPVALSIHWSGDPHYARLRALAEAILLALVPRAPNPPPLVLMIDGDVGRTLGHILEHDLAIGRGVVSIDGISLKEFDFVDIGEMIRPADVVPVVIKSLLFSGAPAHASRGATTAYKPLTERKVQ
jgi:ethanolamine utilization protein EutA